MSFFQNPMPAAFNQSWPVDQSATFTIGANIGAIATIMSLPEPYNFSVSGSTLTINAAFDVHIPRVQYITIAVNVVGVNPAATMASEVVAALVADPVFSQYFNVFMVNPNNGQVIPGSCVLTVNPVVPAGPPYSVQITPIKPAQALTFYVTNCGAESELQFNRQAKIKQLPTYFARDTIANRFTYPDGSAMLVQLDPTVACQAQLIINANEAYPVGLVHLSATVTTTNTSPFTVGDSVVITDGTTTVSATISTITTNVSLTLSAPWTGVTESGYIIDILADWQLLGGRSDHETFNNLTYDGSGRLVSNIEYFTGLGVGDMATKTQYTYVGANTFPATVTTIPYTLTASDLVTPP